MPLDLLIAAAAVQGAAQASLDQLRARPDRYRRSEVRVAGQVDQCWNFTCNLCPLEATPAAPQRQRCLAISFDRFRGGPDNQGADIDGAFRYADVVVTARLDPACLQSICTDRAPVLRDARVEQVTRRRRSSEGLIERPDPLVQIPDEAARPLLVLVSQEIDPSRPLRAFATARDRERSAVVCRSGAAPGDAAQWPRSWQGAITSRSTEDRYRCWTARRGATGWVLDPN